MNHPMLRCCVALLLIGIGLCWFKPAQAAISCSASMSNLNFGNVDPQSTRTDSTATLTYTCSNDGFFPPTYSAMVCFSIGEPGGGPFNPRQMHDAANDILAFQLYQDPGRSTVWGSQFYGFPTPLMVPITLQGGLLGRQSITGTATLYGRVLTGQNTAMPGHYADHYGPGDTAITINQRPGSNPPSSCSESLGERFGSFTVSATVVNKCTVTATTLNFGTVGLLASAIDATSSLGVQCSRGTPYNVGLDAGLHGGGNINARKMTLGARSIGYQLYRDPGRTNTWGNTVGTDTIAGTGTGNTQSLTVYGRVPAQPTPPAGTYHDTVTVTVTY